MISLAKALLVPLAIMVFVATQVAVAAPKMTGVNDAFAMARAAYGKGDFKKAASILVPIIKRYPAHQPSLIMMGHIMYRVGQPQRAIKYFERVEQHNLSSDDAFEYGLSLFANRECRGAVNQLRRVHPASKSKDIADFYIGVCYFRSGHYQQSLYFLSKARRLPPDLQQSKQRYAAACQGQLQYDRDVRSRMTPTTVYTQPVRAAPIYNPYYQGPPTNVVAPGQGEKKKEEKPPEPPKVGFSRSVTPRASGKWDGTRNENYGYQVTDSTTQTLTAGLDVGLNYDVPDRVSLSFPINTDYAVIESTGLGYSYFVYQSDPNTVRTKEEVNSEGGQRYLSVAVTPQATFPLGKKADFSAGYYYFQKLVDMHYGSMPDSAQQRKPFTNLTLKLTEQANITAEARYFQGFTEKSGSPEVTAFGVKVAAKYIGDVSGEVSTDYDVRQFRSGFCLATNPDPLKGDVGKDCNRTALAVNGEVSKTWDTITAKANLGYSKSEPPTDNPIPEGSLVTQTGSLTCSKTFELWVKVEGVVTYTNFPEFRKKGLEVPGQTQPDPTGGPNPVPVTRDVLTSGSSTSGTLTVTITPTDWFTVKGSYTYGQNTYDVGDQEMIQPFQKAVSDVTQSRSVEVGLKKTF